MITYINRLLFFIFIFTTFASANVKIWEKLKSPVQDDLHDVFFINDTVGWAYTYGTGIVVKTSNGGNNWMIISKLALLTDKVIGDKKLIAHVHFEVMKLLIEKDANVNAGNSNGITALRPGAWRRGKTADQT